MSPAFDPHYEVALDLPAVHRGVRVARNVIRHFARLWGMKDVDVDSVVLVVSELLANTIDHGGGGAAMEESELDDDVRMRLTFTIRSEVWSVSVVDRGGGDPEDVRKFLEDTGLPDLEDERGRGFFMMREMVDRMAVCRSADGLGLEITAEKAFSV